MAAEMSTEPADWFWSQGHDAGWTLEALVCSTDAARRKMLAVASLSLYRSAQR